MTSPGQARVASKRGWVERDARPNLFSFSRAPEGSLRVKLPSLAQVQPVSRYRNDSLNSCESTVVSRRIALAQIDSPCSRRERLSSRGRDDPLPDLLWNAAPEPLRQALEEHLRSVDDHAAGLRASSPISNRPGPLPLPSSAKRCSKGSTITNGGLRRLLIRSFRKRPTRQPE